MSTPNYALPTPPDSTPVADSAKIMREQSTIIDGVMFDHETRVQNAEQSARDASLLVDAPAGEAVKAAISPGGAAHPMLLSVIDNKLEGFVNVKDYGAIGDGLNDDLDAIESAVSAGSIVYFPPGVYLIRDELRIPSNTAILGAGIGATTIKVAETAPDLACGITNAGNTRIAHTNEDHHIYIGDLTVDANAWNRTMTNLNQPAQSGITLACVAYSTVERVEVINGGLHGIDISASVYRNTDMGYAPGASHNIRLSQVQAWNTRFDDGITTHHSYAVTISDSHSEQTNQPDFQQNGFEIDEGSRDILLVSCTAKGWAQGFQVKGHQPSQPADDVTLINCLAIECNFGFYIWWAGSDTEEHRGTNVSLLGCGVDNLKIQSTSPEHQILTSILTEFYSGVKIQNFKIKNTPDGGYVRINKWSENIEIDGLVTEKSFTGAALEDRAVIQSDNRVTGRIAIRKVTANEVKCDVVRIQGNPNLKARFEISDIEGVAHSAGVAKPVVSIYSSQSGMSVENIRRTGFTKNFEFFSGFLTGIGGDFNYVVRDTKTMLMPVALQNGFTGTVEYSRDGNMVTVMVYTLTPPAGTNGTVTFGNIPVEFAPPAEVPLLLQSDVGESRNVWITNGGTLRGVFDSALGRVRGYVTYCV